MVPQWHRLISHASSLGLDCQPLTRTDLKLSYRWRLSNRTIRSTLTSLSKCQLASFGHRTPESLRITSNEQPSGRKPRSKMQLMKWKLSLRCHSLWSRKILTTDSRVNRFPRSWSSCGQLIKMLQMGQCIWPGLMIKNLIFNSWILSKLPQSTKPTRMSCSRSTHQAQLRKHQLKQFVYNKKDRRRHHSSRGCISTGLKILLSMSTHLTVRSQSRHQQPKSTSKYKSQGKRTNPSRCRNQAHHPKKISLFSWRRMHPPRPGTPISLCNSRSSMRMAAKSGSHSTLAQRTKTHPSKCQFTANPNQRKSWPSTPTKQSSWARTTRHTTRTNLWPCLKQSRKAVKTKHTIQTNQSKWAWITRLLSRTSLCNTMSRLHHTRMCPSRWVRSMYRLTETRASSSRKAVQQPSCPSRTPKLRGMPPRLIPLKKSKNRNMSSQPRPAGISWAQMPCPQRVKSRQLLTDLQPIATGLSNTLRTISQWRPSRLLPYLMTSMWIDHSNSQELIALLSTQQLAESRHQHRWLQDMESIDLSNTQEQRDPEPTLRPDQL